MAEIAPFILNKPNITLGGEDLTCMCHQVTFSPDQDTNDYDTFCAHYTSYGPLKMTVTLSMYASFGTDGFWTILAPMQNTVQTLTVTPDAAGTAGTIDNPTASAQVQVPGIPFLDANVGEASDFDLDFVVQGNVTYTPAVVPAAEAAVGAPVDTTTTPAAV
jgi:hypothetical protein